MADNSSENFQYESSIAVAVPEVEERQRPARGKDKPQFRRQPPYNVIIWNDDTHTYEYVIELLMEIFGHPFEKAFQITDAVHKTGRGIAFTTHKELAELKCEQVHGAGADWRMEQSSGPIRASIEPVE
jgi:ATP-dependent Clp protease adaptor protein ClpS